MESPKVSSVAITRDDQVLPARRLALAVIHRAVRDHRHSRNAEMRRQLREWVASADGVFYCDIADVHPNRVQAAMRKQRRGGTK